MKKSYQQLLEEKELLYELVKMKNRLIRNYIYKSGGQIIQTMVKINKLENQLYSLNGKGI